MKVYTLFAALLLIALFSCNKPSDFGKEFVSGNNIPFDVIDTFSLKAISEPGARIRMYVPGSTATSGNSIVGAVRDDEFGIITANIYAQFVINKAISSKATNLSASAIDSVVWDVYYDADSTGQYGDLSSPISLDVFKITENVNNQDTLYSDFNYQTDAVPVSSISNFIPKPFPSDSSHLRFRFNNDFVNYLKSLPDSTFNTSSKLQEQFEGLSIKPNGETKSMIRLNMVNTNNRLTIYYKPTASDTTTSIILITNGNCVRHTSFTHDYTGSRFQKYLDNPTTDSVLFIQSLAGPRVKITLPDLSYLKYDALNFAELELTVTDPISNLYALPLQLWLFKKNSDGELISTTDGSIALTSSLASAYGGTKEEFTENGLTKYKYKIRLPKYLTDYIDGKETNELYLSMLYSGTLPARVLLNGPNTKANPMKLKLIVSRIL